MAWPKNRIPEARNLAIEFYISKLLAMTHLSNYLMFEVIT